MGELIKFPVPEKENKEVQNNKNKEVDLSSFEEKTAINSLSREKYDFVLNLKKNNPALRSSDTYRNAYELMVKTSRVEIVNMINNATEIEIKMKPAYFVAAFNILCDTI